METSPVSWFVHAVPLPDGDQPVDLWVDRGGCLVREPVAGAEQLPGHYVVPGLVDAHAHPTVAGTDTAGPLAREIALLAEHGLGPAAALQAATTTAYQFLGEPCDQTGQPATLVTYLDDPRGDLAIRSSPAAIIIDGIRVR
jgi:imidazolonepropionase-like amidohydrolase